MKEHRLTILGSPKVGKTLLTLQFVRDFPYGDKSNQTERKILWEISDRSKLEHPADHGGVRKMEYYMQLLPKDIVNLIDQYLMNPLPDLDFTCDDTYRIKIQMEDHDEMIQIKDLYLNDRSWATSNPKFEEWAQNSDVLVVVYDITSRDSFDDILPLLCTMYTRKFFTWLPVVLVGTKNDMEKSRKVPKEEVELLASQLKLSFYEMSSQTGENVVQVFKQAIGQAKSFRPNRKKYKKKEFGWRKNWKQGKYNWIWLPCMCVTFTLIAFAPWGVLMILAAVN